MNNIYKVIWSKAKNCYVVASEIARSHTKSASGSEKIGGVTRRSLLASLMALSLLCGGLGVAEATVHVNEGTGVTHEVYTTGETYNKTEVDSALTAKGAATEVAANKTDIANLKTAVGDAGSGLTKAVADQNADIATSKANITALQNELGNKADTTALNNKADKATTLAGYGIGDAYTKGEVDNALNSKADKATTLAGYGIADAYSKGEVDNALNNKADKATTLAGYGIADAYSKGEVDNALNNKADKATTLAGYGITDAYTKGEVDNAVAGAVTTAGNNVDTKLTEYAKTTYVDTEVGKKADKATTLAGYGITDAYTKGEVDTRLDKKADQTALTQATDKITENKNAIDGLNAKTINITHDAAGTSVDGVTFNAGKVTGVTSIDGTVIGTKEGGAYIQQDNSIWGNMKIVDTQVKTNADAIAQEKTDREKAIGSLTEDKNYIKKANNVSDNLVELDKQAKTNADAIAQEKTDREKAIGSLTEDKNYIKKANNVSDNLVELDKQAKTNADAIAQETADRKAAIGQLAVDGNYIEKDKNVSDNLVKLDNQAKANADEIVKTNDRTGGITRNLEKTQTTIENAVKVDNQGNVKDVKNLSAETITTTGNASIGGDLKVAGTITTDKMIFGDKATNNYTEIDHGKVTSKNLVVNGAGETISSSSTFNAKKNEVGFANSATGEQSSHKQTSDVIKDTVKNNITGDQSFHKQTSDVIMDNVKDGENSNNRTQTKTETKDIITDKDGNSSTTSQTASENKTYLKDKDGKNTNSTIDTAKGYDKTIKGENGETSTKQDELNITNTAQNGTITNDAQNIVNNASNSITDKVGTNTRVTTSTSITDTVGTANRKIENDKITDTAGDSTVTTENGKGTTFAKTGSTAFSTDVGAPTDTNIAGNHITTGRVDANELGVSDKDGANTADLSVKAGEGVKASAGNGTTTGSLDVTAEEVGSSVTDASGKGSTFKQRIDAIMGNVKTDAGESEVTQKGDEITSVVGKGEATNSRVTQKKGSLEAAVTDGTNTNVSYDIANASAKVLTDGTKVNKLQDNLDSSEKTITNGTYTTSKVQTALDITNTAKDGTITNDAKNIVNNATGDMTNTVGGNQTNIIGGNQTTTVTGDISNKAKNITNEATEKLTDKVGDHTRVLDNEGITDTVGGSTFKQRIDKIMMESKDVSIKAEETLTNEAKVITNKASEVINNEAININNTATGIITSKASEIKNQADKLISNKVGENTWENMENGKITTSIKDGAKQNLTESNADGLKHAVTDGTSINASATTATSSAQTIVSGGKANSVITTIDGTQFVNSDAAAPVTGASGAGTADRTTIKGNTITTGKVKMDYAEVMKDLGVHGSAKVDNNLEVVGTSTLTGDVTMENNATVKKDLAVGGNANITGDVTANSYKVGDKTYISAAGINANDQKITNVADGSISEGSKDAVNGGQLYGVKRDLEHQVDKVGANAAAMANLRPMEFDPSSKWNIAAAIGNYGSETAAALGAFYRPNDNVMVNLSTAFGTGENMVGGGVSVRLGKGGNKLSREETNALKAQVDDLTARMDALLSVLNPNMSKDFPDVPENHWAYEAVSRLAGNDIVQGYPDGEFHGERTMTRYEMAEIIYNALSRGAEAERELVEEFKPELQAMAASEKATAEKAEG